MEKMMEENLDNSKTDLAIVLCGEAGQGIQTIENALTQILHRRRQFHDDKNFY
jgi:hypothetical protein